MEASQIDLQERLIHAIGASRWSLVDEIWAEVMAADELPLRFHIPVVAKLIRKTKQPQHFPLMYGAYVDQLIEKEQFKAAYSLIEHILTLDEKQDWLRGRLVITIEMLFGEDFGAKLPQFIQESGLRDDNVTPGKALQKFRDLLGARKGEVFVHRSWGIGVVRELDLDAGKAVIDFELQPNKQMTLDGVRQFLRPLPHEHIQARIITDRDQLKEMTRSEAGEVLRLALHSLGSPLKVADLKKVLTTRFLSEAEYKTFWEKARKAIKLDPWIDQEGTGATSRLVHRDTPRSFFDEIIHKLVKASTPAERYEILRDVRRHGADAEMSADNTRELYELFLRPLGNNTLNSDRDRLQHGLLFLEFSDLFEGKENPVDVDALLCSPMALELFQRLSLADSRRLAAERIKELHPDHWAEMLAESVTSLDPRTAAWLIKEFEAQKKDHERQVALESILAKPDANPDLFVWAAKNLFDGAWGSLGESFPLGMIIEELLSLLAELSENFEHPQTGASSKAAAGRVRNLMADNNCKYFKKAIGQSTVEEARRILQTIRLHNAISHQLKHALETVLIDKHSDLRQVSRVEEEEEKKKPSFHYATRAALDEKRATLSRLVSHEIPAMAKVIQAARELGDLRENSEYHAAKDRQKLLMQQAAELEDLIARARVVEAREVSPDTTRFGTRVRYRDTSTDELREVTLLGMWEADLQRNIISYLTPFGSQLLGKKVGDEFTVLLQDGGRLDVKIEEISVAPAAGGEAP